jgi:hypothetical protein
MFHWLSTDEKSFWIDLDAVVCVSFGRADPHDRHSPADGNMVAEITFAGGAKIDLKPIQPEWKQFIKALEERKQKSTHC